MWWEKIASATPYLLLVAGFLMVKILRVFTQHQQRMAEILNRSSADHAEIRALREDLAEMKALLTRGESLSQTPPTPTRVQAGPIA